MVRHAKSITCPLCKEKMNLQVKISQLSKNYIALELANKQFLIRKNTNICKEHQEPQIFYCEDEKIQFCAQCIEAHSGHKFIKIKYDLNTYKEKFNCISKLHSEKKEKINSTLNKFYAHIEGCQTAKE